MKKVMGTEVKGLTGVELDKAIELVMVADGVSKSGKMKQLFDLGVEVKDIAKLLGVRYNFVYNVVSNYCIVNEVKVETVKQASKKDDAFGLFDEGKTVKEVAITLKTNYQYIYKLHKEWKDEVVKEVADQEVAVGSTKGDK